MTTKTTYIAFDGKEFMHEAQCERYEKELEHRSKVVTAEQYIEEHEIKIDCDCLTQYDGLDTSWWTGHIVRLGVEMANRVAILTGDPVVATNALAMLEESEDGDWYIIPSLKSNINGIKESLKPFEELLKEE